MKEEESITFDVSCEVNSDEWKVVGAFVKGLYNESERPMELYSHESSYFCGLIGFAPDILKNAQGKVIKITFKGYGDVGYIPDDMVDQLIAFETQNPIYKTIGRVKGGPQKTREGIINKPYEISIELFATPKK